MKRVLAAAMVLGLTACASAPEKKPVAGPASSQAATPAKHRKKSPYAPAREDLSKRGDYTAGGLYAPGVKDAAPGEDIDISLIPEPDVVAEPRSRYGNRDSYAVLGKTYRVLDKPEGYVEQGIASYYGTKFHGRRTSNMEIYDVYAFSAAHKSLPLPSFARVTNLDNGESVVVRVNDRGPFHENRLIDLSYAAAIKLGITRAGTGRVEVRALAPGEESSQPLYASAANNPPPVAAALINAAPSTLDTLVSALPIGSAGAAELPPGVRIATGKPTRLDGGKPAPAKKTASAERPTGVHIASGKPAPVDKTVPAPEAEADTASAALGDNDWRFDMQQNGKAMTADQFDTWMRTRQVRVATGKPGASTLSATAADANAEQVANVQSPPAQAVAAETSLSTSISAPAANHDQQPVPAGSVILQVAAFAARGNADRALGMLRGAGIEDARLTDADSNGQKVWRLRVGPLAADNESSLVARLVGLGFAQPRRVRE